MIEVVKKGDKYFRVYSYVSKSKEVECDENGNILTRKERSDKGKSRAKKYKERTDRGKKHNVNKIRKDKGKIRFMYGGKLTKKCMPTIIKPEMQFENLYQKRNLISCS